MSIPSNSQVMATSVLNFFPFSCLIAQLNSNSARWKKERTIDNRACGWEVEVNALSCHCVWFMFDSYIFIRGAECDGGSRTWRWSFPETELDFTFEGATSCLPSGQLQPLWQGTAWLGISFEGEASKAGHFYSLLLPLQKMPAHYVEGGEGLWCAWTVSVLALKVSCLGKLLNSRQMGSVDPLTFLARPSTHCAKLLTHCHFQRVGVHCSFP